MTSSTHSGVLLIGWVLIQDVVAVRRSLLGYLAQGPTEMLLWVIPGGRLRVLRG